MTRPRGTTLATALALALALAMLWTGSVAAGGRPFRLALSSAQEVPEVPAGVSATGSGRLTINPGTGQVCFSYRLTGTNIGTIVAAHIHEAPAGDAGPVVLPLPTNGGCTSTTDRGLLVDILRNRTDYYVNIHSTTAPLGVARDQLDR